MDNKLRHGTWWDLQKDAPLAKLMEGRFTRLFTNLPAATFPDGSLEKLATAMVADPESPPTPEDETDAEENPAIAAVYTYLGQFIDHDLTFDPASNLREKLTPDRLLDLVDFRTPRFDLDSLYGRGPSDQPYLYQSDGIRLALGDRLSGNPHDGGARDLPRGPNGRALIGDPRNDENRVVAQLHATMLRFHNAMADAMPGADFAAVRDQVRWHYQWVVVNDFLPTIIQPDVVAEVFPHLDGGSITTNPPNLSIPKLGGGLELMPVELSVGAYRFGHSMIRPIYRLNESIARRQIFSTSADPAGDLGGMRPIPDDWAIDWRYFIDLAAPATASGNDGNDPVAARVQHAYKIDTSLVNPLGMLPPSIAADPSSLALRNLQRGVTFQLPSGEAVADALGVKVIPGNELLFGKATHDDAPAPMASIFPELDGNTPLWVYVLAEAHTTSWAKAGPKADEDGIGIRLGPVGGRIVAEVFASLLLADHAAFPAQESFAPMAQFTNAGTFGLAELITVATSAGGGG